jgi:hypothetical protein
LTLSPDERQQVDEAIRDPLLHAPLDLPATHHISGEQSYSRPRYLKIVDFVDRVFMVMKDRFLKPIAMV